MKPLSILAIATCAAVLCAPSAAALRHGELHERIAAVTRRIELEPRRAALHLARAELSLLHGEDTAACADLARAAQLAPATAALACAQARFDLAHGWRAAAIARIDRAVLLHPRSAEAWQLRAELRASAGDTAGAIRSYARAIEHARPVAPELYLALAELLAADEHTLPAALAQLDEGIARMGDVPALQELAIALERRMARFDAALARIDLLARRSTRTESWLALRGDVQAQAGRREGARASWNAALAALRSVPPRRRATAASRELEALLLRSIQALDSAPDLSATKRGPTTRGAASPQDRTP